MHRATLWIGKIYHSARLLSSKRTPTGTTNMRPSNYDSEFCGSLPIHLTNLVQPYGILLVIDKNNHTIIQSSENTEAAFGLPVDQIVGTSLISHIAQEAFDALLKKLDNNINDKIPAVWSIGGNDYVVLIHRKDRYLLVELDLNARRKDHSDSFVNVYQELKYVMTAIEGAKDLRGACNIAATELKRLSGFDKVMIYTFDRDWNGYVIAEAMEQGMESYLGFTFPASDIPRQARQLYLKNPYRLIPDRNYAPVKLYPVVNPLTNSFIDLSDCNLRSVAAVHVEYLGNMGITASMSTRILCQDELWGLITCHHRTPRYLSYEMCSAFELLSGIMSLKVTSLKAQESHSFRDFITVTYGQLIESVYRNQDLTGALMDESGLLKLFDATGAALTREGKVATTGVTPDQSEIEELVLWLQTRDVRHVLAIDSVGREFEPAMSWGNRASGILVIPVNIVRDQYVILFRPERIREITWGGNPEERIRLVPNEKNYHPRNSFKQWQERVSGTSAPWRAEELDAARALRSFIYEFETTVVHEQ
jgi:chemotaxis family two-component system sensor kinase Cph1